MAKADKIYADLLRTILETGDKKPGARAGMPGTISCFAEQIKFDLREGFPLLTTKKVSFKNIKTELIWFLTGDTDITYLRENKCFIWDDDLYRHFTNKVAALPATLVPRDRDNVKQLYPNEYLNDTPGDLTPIGKEEFFKRLEMTDDEVDFDSAAMEFNDTYKHIDFAYPHQWRSFGEGPEDTYFDEVVVNGFDQIAAVLTSLKTQPFGRRHIVTAWNPKEVDRMALPSCHSFFQFNVSESEGVFYLDCALTQRSCDTFLGLPYNIASYALLTHMFGKFLGYTPRYLSMTLNDAHIYENHLEAVNEILERNPQQYDAPELILDGTFDKVADYWAKDGNTFELDDFLTDLKTGRGVIQDIRFKTAYESFSRIKAPLSVGL